MARRSKDAPIDLASAHDFSAGLIDALKCPQGKAQAFLRDTKAPGLRVRVTAAGAKAYVFEGKLRGHTIRRTIGDVRSWQIDRARAEANRLRVALDAGEDPRETARARLATAEADRMAKVRAGVTVSEAWSVYVAERKPRWGDLTQRDHERLAQPGGKESKRGTRGRGVTSPGPLHAFMDMPLRELDSPAIDRWADQEGQTRPATARLAWRLLRGFLNWCIEHPDFAALLGGKNPANSKKARESLGAPATKRDVLQREQLAAWFEAVRQISNPTIATAVQVMLLTGARPGEVLSLRWNDIDFKWHSISIHDKVEGERLIPATPYVCHLLNGLQRANDWVFASARFELGRSGKPSQWVNMSASGRISEPNTPHTRACIAAGIPGLTLHGLRRSFASLTEWLEIPAGVVAQIMGHKPSATAEKHYKVRPLDLLRQHHEKIEGWMLKTAGIQFVPKAEEKPALQLVVAA